ncbi:MAG: hypothetical protein J7507_12035 [Pseudoxanthomonas sp.]|nr:hypothetical protein [Pseudoxanthomonas sp.]
MTLPTDRAARKAIPMYSGVLAYFPAALAQVAIRSREGNEEHNPGEPLHWARGKSNDHLDCLARHLVEGDLVGVAWRALAALQLECEANGAPLAPGARNDPSGRGRQVLPIVDGAVVGLTAAQAGYSWGGQAGHPVGPVPAALNLPSAEDGS